MTGTPGTGFPHLLLAPMLASLFCGAWPGLRAFHTKSEQQGLVAWTHIIVLCLIECISCVTF